MHGGFHYVYKAGTTDVSVEIYIVDADGHTPETGVVFNTAGLDLQYRRQGAASVAITEATLAGLNAAHSDGGFLHIGNGLYRLDLPDAACAAGARGAVVHGTVPGMIVYGCSIQLVVYDPYSATQLFPVPGEGVASPGEWGIGVRNIVYGLTDENIGQGAGVATAHNAYDLSVRFTVDEVEDAGNFTIILEDYAGNAATNNQFKDMFCVFRDGPNAKRGQVVSAYTGAEFRLEFTSEREDGKDIPFPNEPEPGNSGLLLGLA